MSVLVDAWYRKRPWLILLTPLSLLFWILSSLRRLRFALFRKGVYQAGIPVIVIGNVTAGGTGKTPLVVTLAHYLKNHGYRPGIVTRGYKAKPPSLPYLISAESTHQQTGDEALMISRHTHCPVVISPKRAEAIQYLEKKTDCDIILSDDGLQHYRMGRDIEIIVVDGSRGLGNRWLLPAGPLRESAGRLNQADYVICNGNNITALDYKMQTMRLMPQSLFNLKNNQSISLDSDEARAIINNKVHAVAGIGNPERFFTSLCNCGFDIITHIFPDHHDYQQQELQFQDDLPIVMTEKDAIKCVDWATEKFWYLSVTADLPDTFYQKFLAQISALKNSNQ